MTDELKTVNKVADATKEVAKATGQGISAASGAGRFFEKVFGDLVIDGVGLLGDRLKHFRDINKIKLANKTQEFLNQRNVRETRAVPPKLALPLIESACLEDDDDLHTLWARLLTSAMDVNHEIIERKYISVLQDLSKDDARLVEYIFREHNAVNLRINGDYGSANSAPPIETDHELFSLLKETNSTKDNVRNLVRLGLLAPSASSILTVDPNQAQPPTFPTTYRDDDIASAKGVTMMMNEVLSKSRQLQTKESKIYNDIELVHITAFGLRFCLAVS